MDLNRYDGLVQETCYVKNKLIEKNKAFGGDPNTGVMAAILVATEHSNKDLGQLALFMQSNVNKRKFNSIYNSGF